MMVNDDPADCGSHAASITPTPVSRETVSDLPQSAIARLIAGRRHSPRPPRSPRAQPRPSRARPRADAAQNDRAAKVYLINRVLVGLVSSPHKTPVIHMELLYYYYHILLIARGLSAMAP